MHVRGRWSRPWRPSRPGGRRSPIVALLGVGLSDSNAGGSGATASPGLLSGGLNIAGKEVLFIHSSDTGNPFDVPVVSGSDAAAKLTGLKVNTQFSDGDATKLRNLFQSGISTRSPGSSPPYLTPR